MWALLTLVAVLAAPQAWASSLASSPASEPSARSARSAPSTPRCSGLGDCDHSLLQGVGHGVGSAPARQARALSDDPTHNKQVLPEGAARMTEDLRREDDEDDDDAVVEEGRALKPQTRRRTNKLGKKMDGTLLQILLMLKIAPLVFIATKVAVLSFLVQMKSLVLTLVSTAIAAVQFFWRVQEKRHGAGGLTGGLAGGLGGHAAAGWEEGAGWPDRRKYISI